MSRGAWDDIRDEATRPEREHQAHDPERARHDQHGLSHDIDLPRGDARETVERGDHLYALRGSETTALTTIGAFRVVPATDLDTRPAGQDVWHGDVAHLVDQGLIERMRVAINGEPTDVLALTRDGKALLDDRRETTEARVQQYHAGFAKPRELSHDAQLYRLYREESERIREEGGRIVRVVLDAELKHDYQTFLHRGDREDEAAPADDLQTFAEAARLPIVEGHLELPDLRIEFETPDGRLEYRDLELVTEHYSRSQLAGKAQAGFTVYQAAGRGRLRGTSSGKGGTPHDPHHLERWA